MKINTLRRKVEQLRRAVEHRRPPDLSQRPDPIDWVRQVANIELDDWQKKVMTSDHKRALLLCSRQTGKTETVALKCAYEAAFNHQAHILAIAPSLRQSRNLFERIEHALLNTEPYLKIDVHTRTTIRLGHGGTVRALPGDRPDMVRGLTATQIILDEAAFVRDEILAILLPMLATTGGSMTMLTTPSGPSGLFYQAWHSDSDEWDKTRVLATECPRITPEFLDEARRKLGPLAFAQEYECRFIQTASSFFNADVIAQAFEADPYNGEASPYAGDHDLLYK